MSNSHFIYLNRADIERSALPMAQIIDAVETSLIEKAHGRVQMPSKHWMEPHPKRWFGGMSCLIPAIGSASMKWQSGSSENSSRGLPYLTGMLFLNNLDDGLVDAVMDSTWITQERTAAESAVAAKYLAKPRLRSYAQLGCGVQARSHLRALLEIMPSIDEVIIFDIDDSAAQAFADEVKSTGLRAKVVLSPREAVDLTDLVVTAGPIEPDANRPIDSDWLHPGMLGIAIDYDCYWSASAFAAADKLFTDDVGQIDHIRNSGYFTGCPTIRDELGQVAAGTKSGRESDEQVIIACNMGVAVEDVATAKAIYDIALKENIGTRLER